MSGNSNVGTSAVYEAGDQRTSKNSELDQGERYKQGKPNSHLANDSSMFRLVKIQNWRDSMLTIFTEDERSIANKLAREEKVRNCLQIRTLLTASQRQNESDFISEEAADSQKDPTLPV